MAFRLNQGRFIGRPSELLVEPHGDSDHIGSVRVGGDVAIVGGGRLEAPPSTGQLAQRTPETGQER